MWRNATLGTDGTASTTLADHRERGPEERMCDLGGHTLAGIRQHGELRVAQGAGDSKIWIFLQSPQRVGHQECRHLVIDRPVRDLERPRAGIEEGARQTGETCTGRRTAGPS